MANGRVLTGFSLPYIAVYSNSGTTVTYSDGQILARGVSVSLDVETSSDDNIFYADNVASETVAGTFSGGTCTLTVDGLLQSAEQLLLGLPSANADGFVLYGDSQSIPYVGLGFVCRYMSDSTTTYVPVVLTKCRPIQPNLEAATQEEEIDWQTQEIEFTVLRDDTSNATWKMVGTGQSTEALAAAMIESVFNIT